MRHSPYHSLRLHQAFKLYCLKNPIKNLSKPLEKKIDSIWQSKVKEGCYLFDGQIFCFLQMNKKAMWGSFIPYRWHVALQHSPELRSQLPLLPIAVSAVTVTPSGRVLLGRRSPQLSFYPGFYEFVAAGSIDPSSLKQKEKTDEADSIDYFNAVKSELCEETSLARDLFINEECFGVIFDELHCCLELCIQIVVEESAFSKLLPQPKEYSELITLPAEEVDSFLKLRSDETVPFSYPLWKSWQKRHEGQLSGWSEHTFCW